MADRLKRQDYVSTEAKQLEEQLKVRIKEDKELALAQRLVDKIPAQRKKYVLQILSNELATKN